MKKLINRIKKSLEAFACVFLAVRFMLIIVVTGFNKNIYD